MAKTKERIHSLKQANRKKHFFYRQRRYYSNETTEATKNPFSKREVLSMLLTGLVTYTLVTVLFKVVMDVVVRYTVAWGIFPFIAIIVLLFAYVWCLWKFYKIVRPMMDKPVWKFAEFHNRRKDRKFRKKLQKK